MPGLFLGICFFYDSGRLRLGREERGGLKRRESPIVKKSGIQKCRFRAALAPNVFFYFIGRFLNAVALQ